VTALSMQTLRELAAFRTQRSPYAISLYVDLDPSETPTAVELDARIGSLLSKCSREVEEDEPAHEQRLALRRDLERIDRYFDEEFERNGARGLALFSSSADELWRVLRLGERVSDDARIERRLFLLPLVPLAHESGEYLVVVVGREQGQIWLLEDGKLELLDDRFQEQERRHDQGGWAQARYARHIESHVHEHLRDLAGALQRRLREHDLVSGLVIAASEETRPELERLLPPEVRRLPTGWIHVDAHAGASELKEATRPFLERRRRARVAEQVERWRTELGHGTRACVGWRQTVEAASDGRVEELVYEIGLQGTVWLCERCERISARPGRCPLDGTTTIEQRDGLELLVHRILERGGLVLPLLEESLRPEREKVGALLRY
jgi:peptide chain release factor subunit 1